MSQQHDSLVSIAYGWARQRFGAVLRELSSANREIPDIIAFSSSESMVIECKATRSDFLADKKKPFRIYPSLGMGKFRFYLCREGVIEVEDLPEGWGLLIVKGRGLRVEHNPYSKGGNIWSGGFEHNEEAERRILYSALRRMEVKGHLRKL